MSLKEFTKDLHLKAEKTTFAKKLIKGNLTVEEYANYLWQMVMVYNGIESIANSQGILLKLYDIDRTHKIYQDCIELVGPNHQLKWKPTTIEYYKYLLDLNNDSQRRHLIKAHLYCRHMGDLYGGQLIKNKVPGKGRFYEFKDPEGLKTAIRAELTNDLGPEARVAFEWSIKIMESL